MKDRKLKQRRSDPHRNGRAAAIAATLVLSLPFGLSLPAQGQNSPASPAAKAETLQSTEQALRDAKERAATLARNTELSEAELMALRQRLIAVAAREHERTGTVDQLERRMADLIEREAVKKASLNGQRGQLAALIAALQRIAATPPTALIALPAAPADTIRSALLLRGTVPAIEDRARVLARDLEALAELRTALVSARIRLDAERKTLQQDRTALEALVARKASALTGTKAAQQQAAAEAAKLGRDAISLRDLVRKLEAARETARLQEEREALRREAEAQTRLREKPAQQAVQSPPAPRIKPQAKQQDIIAALPPPDIRQNGLEAPRSGNLPVPGRIVGAFGAAKDGAPSDGVTVSSRPGASVIAPQGGTVVFAGPFKGLGKLLIIEHRGAYHLLLAGLARIDASIGEKVLAGEPVGVMPATGPADPTLYMELRRKGRPVNPTPWLSARRNGKNG